MPRETRSYDEAIEASTGTLRDDNPLHPLEVRCIERTTRDAMSRSVYEYLVVDHETEDVLYEGRPARPYEQNPSSGEEAARARGYASGYIAAHPEYGGQ